jgi:ABC-type oligopeptide transport system ATPase subunit
VDKELFARQCHPYTLSLLSAIPSLDPDRPEQPTKLVGEIPGAVLDTDRVSFPYLMFLFPGSLQIGDTPLASR